MMEVLNVWKLNILDLTKKYFIREAAKKVPPQVVLTKALTLPLFELSGHRNFFRASKIHSDQPCTLNGRTTSGWTFFAASLTNKSFLLLLTYFEAIFGYLTNLIFNLDSWVKWISSLAVFLRQVARKQSTLWSSTNFFYLEITKINFWFGCGLLANMRKRKLLWKISK